MQMNNNFLPLSITPIILLLLIPAALVFGQTSPWALFQRLCQGGGYATGPQCQNLTQQQLGASASSSSLPSSGSTITSPGTCPNGFTLQGSSCVPTTSSSPFTAGTCPSNNILQNGLCVPITTTQTPSVTTTQTPSVTTTQTPSVTTTQTPSVTTTQTPLP